MSVGGTLSTALLVTLARPATWVLGLAGFLVRGGLLIAMLPIVFLPSPVGLGNLLAPTLVSFVFGGVSMGFLLVLAGIVAVGLAWLLAGGLVAAACEVELIRTVSEDEDVTGGIAVDRPMPTRASARVLAIRLLAMAPSVLVMAWAATRVVARTYRELTLPSDVTTPIAWRVITALPEVVVAIVVAWLVGELVAGVAIRRLALEDRSIGGGLVHGVIAIGRAPLRTVTLFVVPLIALALVLIPTAAASSAAWRLVDASLRDDVDPRLTALAVGAFCGLWLGGLALTGVVCAWRHAVWTVDAVRRRPGTFGATVAARPGDWNPGSPSVTL